MDYKFDSESPSGKLFLVMQEEIYRSIDQAHALNQNHSEYVILQNGMVISLDEYFPASPTMLRISGYLKDSPVEIEITTLVNENTLHLMLCRTPHVNASDSL